MTTVLIVDDQALQRLGLRMLLESQPDLTVVGEAADCTQAVRAATVLQPDVVLLDLDRTDADRVQAIRRITRSDCHAKAPRPEPAGGLPPRVLVLIASDGDAYPRAALRAGADGILLKDSLPEELAAAVRIVARGDSVLSPRLTRTLIEAVRARHAADSPDRRRRLSRLTERETEVLAALASGWSNSEIAERLSIAPTTVKTHISSILTKIGARTRVQAVVFAYETGPVRPPWQQSRPGGPDFSDRPGGGPGRPGERTGRALRRPGRSPT
ncbi:two component transcriptional regulator, LuxR family [Actinobacteria bacterium OK074]|nr:two component transcriptional regulator, LuxR family [Actinobacteria bacterium OK074]